MEDRAGGIWVSSEYTGISRLSVLNEGAERIFPEDETLSDRSNTVRMINRMPDDKIWLGTRRGGLYICLLYTSQQLMPETFTTLTCSKTTYMSTEQI